jgi:hypothetical protein
MGFDLFDEAERIDAAYRASHGLPVAAPSAASAIQYRKLLCARNRESIADRRYYAPKYMDRLPFDEHVAREERLRAA